MSKEHLQPSKGSTLSLTRVESETLNSECSALPQCYFSVQTSKFHFPHFCHHSLQGCGLSDSLFISRCPRASSHCSEVSIVVPGTHRFPWPLANLRRLHHLRPQAAFLFSSETKDFRPAGALVGEVTRFFC